MASNEATRQTGAAEERHETGSAATASAPQLLVFSSQSESALDAATDALREFLANGSVELADVAHTLQRECRDLPHRRMLVCADRADAVAALTERSPNRVLSSRVDDARRSTVFLLPGVGDQYVGMGYGLYTTWSAFRDEVDFCARLLAPHLGADIREVLYPANQSWKKVALSKGIDLKRMLGRGADDPPDADTIRLNTTLFAQPALFTMEYATARLWQSLGISADALVGHSMGEYVAACLAGVFSLEDALGLIALRAKLVNELPQATMLAVMLSEEELRPLLPPGISVSLINGPNHCVVAGIPDEVSAFEATLAARDVIARRVQNGHAFHTRMMEPILPAFESELRHVRLNEPQIPYISNVTGDWVTASQAKDPGYWLKHATQTARFSDALGRLWRLQNPILIECGPGKTLNVLAAQHPDRKATLKSAIWSMRQRYENEHDEQALIAAMGKVWLAGRAIEWAHIPGGETRSEVGLPVCFHGNAEAHRGDGALSVTQPTFEAVAANEPCAAGEAVDQPAVRAAEEADRAGLRAEEALQDDRPANQRERELVAIWKEALGRPRVGVNDSFGALGGDSLSSVAAILAMKRLGVSDEIARGLYRGLTIRQMVRLETAGAAGSAAPAGGIELSSVEMPIFLRAIAIAIVVASHLGVTSLGGNTTLMLVSGLNFAKFQLQTVEKEASVKPIFRLILRLAIPCFLWTVCCQLWGHTLSIRSWLFLDNLSDPEPYKLGESPYFIDLLIQCWLLMAIVLSIRRLRQLAVKRTFQFGLVFLGIAWVTAVVSRLFIDRSATWWAVPNMYLWLMALGWCAAYSRGRRDRILLSVFLASVTVINLYCGVTHVFGWDRLLAGLAIIWFDEIPAELPRPLVQAMIGAAGASLFIYLTHHQFDHAVRLIWPGRPAVLGIVLAMLGGYYVWKMWNLATRMAIQWSRKLGIGGADLRVSAIDG